MILRSSVNIINSCFFQSILFLFYKVIIIVVKIQYSTTIAVLKWLKCSIIKDIFRWKKKEWKKLRGGSWGVALQSWQMNLHREGKGLQGRKAFTIEEGRRVNYYIFYNVNLTKKISYADIVHWWIVMNKKSINCVLVSRTLNKTQNVQK